MKRPRLAELGLLVLMMGNLLVWGYLSLVRPGRLARQAEAVQKEAVAARARGDSRAAQDLWAQVVGLEEAAYGDHDPRLLEALHQISFISTADVADYPTGERYGIRAVEISAPGSNQRLAALEDLAFVYICTARFDEAEPLLEEARPLIDLPYVPSGLEVDYWIRRVDMALKQFRPPQAEQICREALARSPATTMPGRQAELMCWLGISLLRQNKATAAAEAFRSALQGSTAMAHTRELCIEGLIRSLSMATRYGEAEQVYREVHLTATPSMLEALAHMHQDMGNLTAAETEYRRALAMRVNMQGTSHVSVGTTEVWLADVLLAEGHLDDAQHCYTEAIEICRRGVDAEHPHVAQAMIGLGRLYLERRQYPQACQTFQEAARMMEKRLGPDARPLRRVYELLAEALEGAGDVTAAQAIRDRLGLAAGQGTR